MDKHIIEILKERGISDQEIRTMTKNEIFKEVLEWSGIIGYDGAIKRWIRTIYGIEVK